MRTTSARLLLICLFAGTLSAAQTQNAVSLVKKGDVYFYNEKYDSAIYYYSRAVKADPKSHDAYFSLGAAYLKQNKNNEAVANYTNALNTVPPDSVKLLAKYYAGRGAALENKKAKDSAFLDYTDAIKYGSTSPKVYKSRGELFYDRSNYELALKDFSKAIALDSTYADAYRARSRTYYGMDETDSALADITTAMRFDNNILNYSYRGVFNTALGNYEAAVSDLFYTIKNDLFHGTPYINIIAPLARLRRFEEASVFYNLYYDKLNLIMEYTHGTGQFLAFIDKSKTYQFYRYYADAVDMMSYDHLDSALLLLDSASLKYGTEVKNETKRCYADVLALRGYVLEKLHRNDEAKATYQQALMLDEKQPDVADAIQQLDFTMALTRAQTRAVDKTIPEIKDPHLDSLIKTNMAVQEDSIELRVTGTVTDQSGITQVKVGGVAVTRIEEDGFFNIKIKRKATDHSPVVITATDSADNVAEYTFRPMLLMRGAIGTSTNEQAPKFGTYHAILIAEKDYTDPGFKTLQYPIRDANNLKNILTDKYTFDPENIDTLYNRSREDILETIIARCKSLGPDDNLLVFYAGHGDTTMDKFRNIDGYLIPTSAKKGLTSYFITSEEIKKALLKSNARHVLFLLDACYSGAFTRGEDSVDNNVADILKQYEQSSRKVMTSGNIEAVPDNSFFIYYLTEYLKNNKKKYLSTKEIWSYVDAGIRDHAKQTNSNQYYSPQYSAITGVGDTGGTFVFILRKPD